MFQEIFGESFWENVCIVVTHFSNSSEQVDNRKLQGVTKDSKKEAILKVIGDNFHASKKNGLKVPLFFTDCFDLSKPHDHTKSEVVAILRLASNNHNYDVKAMHTCVFLGWKEERDRIKQMYRDMCRDEVISVLGKDEKE